MIMVVHYWVSCSSFFLFFSITPTVYVSIPTCINATEKVWVEPKIIFMWPDKLNTPQLVVCRHKIAKCKFEDCKYKWRIEHNMVNSENNKYFLLIDSDRAVYLKAPLSRTKNLGPFACVVELNGKPLGEGISFIKFLGKFVYLFLFLSHLNNGIQFIPIAFMFVLI